MKIDRGVYKLLHSVIKENLQWYPIAKEWKKTWKIIGGGCYEITEFFFFFWQAEKKKNANTTGHQNNKWNFTKH